jgi:hypothetical protein
MGSQSVFNGYPRNTCEFSPDMCFKIKQIIHNVNLIIISCCIGSNKGQSWSREGHHTAFFLGWNSNEFPTTSKTCSYVKHQFSGKYCTLKWFHHFLLWLLFGTAFDSVAYFSHDLLHNIFLPLKSLLCSLIFNMSPLIKHLWFRFSVMWHFSWTTVISI